ncbi:VCBS repeat-containing protein [Seonamhaeicola marinus]|uniref:VCBS repeat-containing protein n=1 Tax=Seonamhaeicola marinus TaxID=1912246 RepID=A0A5D0HV84_9FLAO|nr:VCBS repeat-containing protein [Seonamhaeicola marinus]TYA74389.1 VCBS repeat-containing protein [Seonamhaeicola marinus]
MNKVIFILSLALIVSCSSKTEESTNDTLFKTLSSSNSNIHFSNNLKETDSLNYFLYTSIYMGGGVAVGDINNDGLDDIFFTGNQVPNKLYLNKGNLQFQDISNSANVAGDSRWYTGVTMADVNHDGYLDIYCSVAGKDGIKNNQLFINNRDLTFSEKGKAYNIDDTANSVQATFFDYDNDGDLDLYIANYPIAHPSTSNMVYKNRMDNVSIHESDKLFRNDGDTFTNVTEEAGVQNYSFSLGITAADINNDGWQDLYVSNDYSIPDFFYINNKDGTFKEVIKEATSQTAFYGMGIDIADINNDGLLDIFQVDMDSNNNRRQKANMASMNPRLFYETVLYGFHYQYMQNNLQLNTGYSENGTPKFSNISRLSGTSSTDWSWGPLLADFDNDGLKDLFVTNGTRREVNNKDFFKKIGKEAYDKYTLLEKTNMIPSEKIDNFMFKNNGDLGFKRVNKAWGIEHKGFSNGAAYADLDNDGDLEIIVNNIDEEASIFENTSSKNNYLQITFNGGTSNKFGLGNRVYVYTKNQTQIQELTLSRGFQSSVAPKLHFGLGTAKAIDSLKIIWQNGSEQVLNNISVNQELVIQKQDAINAKNTRITDDKQVFSTSLNTINHKHFENDVNDFDTQVLLPHKMSTLGPALAIADINGDGLDDYFIGGSFGLSASLYLQNTSGFVKQAIPDIEKDKLSEDIGALFFDVENDGDVDLYVVSGGYEYAEKSEMLQDRLYINDGKGNFSKSTNALPKFNSSGSKVLELDYNKDGKKDLLVLGRQVPGKYPAPTSSYLLKNVSNDNIIKFENETDANAPLFKNLGMATSAVITDFNNDSWQDIIIVGEWMPIKVFLNSKGVFKDVSEAYGLTKDTTGWWWSINQGDFDGDGDTDYIIGNNGLNYKYKATKDETFDIYVNDFDNNKKQDIVLSYYNEGEQYPLRGRQCSSEQIPGIKRKFKNYDQFSQATLVDVYGKEHLENALHYQVKSFASIYLENDNGTFSIHELPIESQFSSINGILVNDYDKDGYLDALIAGNLYNSEVETPRNDASYGLFLKGDGKGSFKAISTSESGFYVPGDVKDLKEIMINHKKYVIAAKNNDNLQCIEILDN